MEIKTDKPLSIFELGNRSNMEDCIYPAHGNATDKDRLFVLCDGMGGHENGEVASGIVCRMMADYIRSHAGEYVIDETVKDALNVAIDELDVEDSGNLRKMGTTMTLLCFHRGGCMAAHIGDSRIYHIRPDEGRIIYKSRDHSLVYDLYLTGEISREEMATYGRKNVITRAIMPNQDERPKADIVHITDIKAGDIFYLCSDGMLEQMDDNEIVDVLGRKMSWEEKRKKLIELTKDNKDNHSAYIIGISEVVMEKGDETLNGDEATSKSNAVFLESQMNSSYTAEVVHTIGREAYAKAAIEKNTNNTMRSRLWMIFFAVMIAVFLIVVFIKFRHFHYI